MPEDKWFRLINDDIADIPTCVVKMKSAYWRKSIIFIVLVAVGAAIMAGARAGGYAAFGCFVAITGVAGMMALATMCHSQLCLYRAIKELRELANPTGEQASGENMGT